MHKAFHQPPRGGVVSSHRVFAGSPNSRCIYELFQVLHLILCSYIYVDRNYIFLCKCVKLHLIQCRKLSWAAGDSLLCPSQQKAQVLLWFPRPVQFLQDNFGLLAIPCAVSVWHWALSSLQAVPPKWDFYQTFCLETFYTHLSEPQGFVYLEIFLVFILVWPPAT